MNRVFSAIINSCLVEHLHGPEEAAYASFEFSQFFDLAGPVF